MSIVGLVMKIVEFWLAKCCGPLRGCVSSKSSDLFSLMWERSLLLPACKCHMAEWNLVLWIMITTCVVTHLQPQNGPVPSELLSPVCVCGHRLTCPLVSELHAGNAAAFPSVWSLKLGRWLCTPPQNGLERSVSVSGMCNMQCCCGNIGLMCFPSVFCIKMCSFAQAFIFCFHLREEGRQHAFHLIMFYTSHGDFCFPSRSISEPRCGWCTSHLQRCCLLWNAACSYRFIQMFKWEKTARLIGSNS